MITIASPSRPLLYLCTKKSHRNRNYTNTNSTKSKRRIDPSITYDPPIKSSYSNHITYFTLITRLLLQLSLTFCSAPQKRRKDPFSLSTNSTIFNTTPNNIHRLPFQLTPPLPKSAFHPNIHFSKM